MSAQPTGAERVAMLYPEPDTGSWSPIDLATVAAEGYDPPTPGLLRYKGSTAGLLYAGRVNGMHGDSGIGKSWIACAAIAQEITTGNNVLVIDYEATAAELVARLQAIGCTTGQIVEHVTYLRPDVHAGPITVANLVDRVTADATTLVVLDSLGEAFAVSGVDENKDNEVGPWIRGLPRLLADAGPAVLLIDHATKSKDNVLFPSGSKRKRAAITGASFLVTAVTPPTREHAGRLKLTCAKDRHGAYAMGAVVASVDVTPFDDGGVTVNLWPATTDDDTSNRTTLIARALVKWLGEQGRPCTGREMLASGAVKGRHDALRAALDYAEGVGAVRVEKGPRNSNLYVHMHEVEVQT